MHKHASANRFYRLVWSHVHACWVVVAESARGRGKSNSSVRAARRLGAVLAGAMLAGGALAAPPPAVNALPTGGQLAAGQANIAASGNQMTVTQGSNQAIINWQRFDIGADAAVRFDQPSASAVALNRVIGNDPSQIYGKLSSNGSVFLVNPQGVLFGASAQVDVGALTASSLNISDKAFLDGQYDFGGSSKAGAVSNAGRINAATGGYVALIAPSVSNSGSISAAQGSVALAAGEQVSVDLRGDGLVGVRTTRGALQALAQNSGSISADGGRVLLSATAADALTRATVNNTGIVQARGIVADGGSIRLVADDVYSGTLDASSNGGKGGSIELAGQAVSIDGALKADGASGGSISASASGNLSAAAPVSATGRSGAGGAISYAAGAALVENTSSVTNADGATDGGATTLGAGASLTSSGVHTARGGSGIGGRIDVSAKDVKLFSSTLDASGNTQGGLVRIGGAFQGGNPRPDAPDTGRFLSRWGQTAAIANASSVFINDSTSIDVSARGTAGQGGTAIAWSQDQTTMLGALNAGGAAAGGAVEISSANELRYVNLDKLALGRGGNLLLDPKNIIISSSASQWTQKALLGATLGEALEAGDSHGFGVALSADGLLLAVGAPYDGGATTPAKDGAPEVKNPALNAGAVRLYSFSDGNFSGATLRGTFGKGYSGNGNVNVNLASNSLFGAAVALSGNAAVLAVGAPGVDGGNGAVYQFSSLLSNTPVSKGVINGGTGTGFGTSVALNGDGSNLAVGAIYANNSAGVVNLYNNLDPASPVFSRSIFGNVGYGLFGTALAYNSAGDKLAVGAINENNGQGKVYLYTDGGSTLAATLSGAASGGNNTQVSLQDGEYFGSALAFNAAGTRLAVGAPNAPAAGSTTLGPGSVRIFDFSNSSYGTPKLGYTIGNGYTFAPDGTVSTNQYDNFGFAVAMNGAGDRLVVGTPYANIGNVAGAGGVYGFSLLNATSTGSVYYGQAGPSSGTTLVNSNSLASLLNGGANVTLQASNDLVLNASSDIVTNNGSALTLQAGRSIVLNSNINLSYGSVTVLANESKPDASTGPVDKDRDPGTAVLTVNGDIAAQNIVLTLDKAGSNKTNTASGAITINGAVNGFASTSVKNLGAGSGNDVVLGSQGKLAGNALEVVTLGSGKFTNGSTLRVSDNGYGIFASNFVVYSTNPSDTTEGLLAGSYSKHYAQTYTGATPSYARSGGWFLYANTPTLTITADSSTKVYNGLVGGGLTYTATGFIDGDTVGTAALSGALGLVNGSKNVGVYSIGKGTLASDMGYAINLVSNNAKQTVTPAALTVNATGIDKVYDTTKSASVNYTSNAIAGDALSFTGTALFDTKDVASGKAVSITGIALGGADAANYTLSNTTASTTASVTPFVLTATASGVSKVYDGSTNATVTLGSNKFAGDTVTLSNTTASYADKNVGASKAISVNGISLSGADAGNYTLASTTASGTGAITPRSLVVTATGGDKVYDGTISASGIALGDNRVSGDVLSLSSTRAEYDNKNAGSGKQITVSGISLSGADAGNYALSSTQATSTGTVSPRVLNTTATGDNKVYDGNTSATVRWSDDRVSGDSFAYSATTSYADKNAGTGKDITVAGLSLAGVDSGNYVLASNTLHASGDITPRTLNVVATGSNKVYDGLVAANVTLSDNHLSGDQLTVSSTGASYGDKNAGANKTITVNGLSLSGSDAGNYVLASGPTTTRGDISARALTISATGVDKVYDGTNTATVSYSDNRVDGDSISYSATALFGDKNAGIGKAVSVTGITLAGADAANYTLGSNSASTTATIGQRTLTVTATGASKVYDGTTSGTATLGDDRVNGDLLTLTATGSTAYADKNAGANKAITVNGVTLGGNDAGNYVLASSTASGTGAITPKTINASVTGNDKVYDGSVTANVTYSENDHVSGDVITITGNAAFGNKNVGAGKTISVDHIALGGADAGNYVLASTTGSTTASITPRALNVSISSDGKVYDGTAGATITIGDDRVSGDALAFTSTSPASYADKNAGTNKTITLNGIQLGGNDAGNYVLSNTSATTQASITPRALVVTGSGVSKVYDGTTSADVTFTDNRLGGDVLTVSVGSASYVDKNVGANKALVFNDATLSGADAGNYTLDVSSNSGTGAITARTLTFNVTGVNKVYDGSTGASVSYTDNRVGGDVLSYNANARFGDKNVGSGKTITVDGITLGGADGGNYVLSASSATTQANITPRALVVSATGASKVYDGLTTATATLGDDRISGDQLTVTGGSASFADKNAGASKALTVRDIALSGVDAGNYTLSSTTASGTGAITPRDLTYTATGASKVYDGTTAATLSFTDNRLAGDSLTYAPVASFADKNVGASKAINMTGLTLGGADAGNYHLVSTTATATGAITPRTLNVSATGGDKVYDGTTVANVKLDDDRVGGDSLSINGNASFASKNAGTQQLVLNGVSLSGADASNYNLSVANAGTAVISPRALSASVTASDKVYDGTTAATIALSANALAGDSVQISGNGLFADKNAGSGKVVTVSGVTLSGADAGNYTLGANALQASASITPRALSTNISASDKIYDGTVTAQYTVTDNRLAGDSLVVGGGTAAFGDKNVGNGKTVTVSGLTLSGADAGNYTLASSSGTATANITQKDLLIQVLSFSRSAGAANPVFNFIVNGLVAGDTLGTASAGTTANAQSAAGTYPITLTGVNLPNYRVTTVNGVLTVVATTSPVRDAISSIVKPELPSNTGFNGGGFTVPSTPNTPQQLLAANAPGNPGGGASGGGSGSGGAAGGSDAGDGSGGNAAPGATGGGNPNAPAPAGQVTTTTLPGGTQVASRNGGIRAQP